MPVRRRIASWLDLSKGKEFSAAAKGRGWGPKVHKIRELELERRRVEGDIRGRGLASVLAGRGELGGEILIKLVVVVLGDLAAIVQEITHERHCVWRLRRRGGDGWGAKTERTILSPRGTDETPEAIARPG